MTPHRMDILLGFIAHDVGGNLVATGIVALAAGAWRWVIKRRQRTRENTTMPASE